MAVSTARVRTAVGEPPAPDTACEARQAGAERSGHGGFEAACWADARSKFFDAARSYPRQSHQVLEWIKQLYDIEDQAHDLPIDSRRELRSRHAVPVLDKIETYVNKLALSALPKSTLGKAVTYARNQWKALRRYTEDGRLTIDNNVSERTLRHQAISLDRNDPSSLS